MLESMRSSLPMFQRYFKTKAISLGKEKLAWWDLFAPSGKTETKYTFSEASNFIVNQFASFSSDLAEFAQYAFDNKWVDYVVEKMKSN